jgi:hypothetical protein
VPKKIIKILPKSPIPNHKMVSGIKTGIGRYLKNSTRLKTTFFTFLLSNETNIKGYATINDNPNPISTLLKLYRISNQNISV